VVTISTIEEMASNLCPVRCFCGQQVQSCYTNYCKQVRAGKSIKEALDTCGLPMSTAFAPPLTAPNSYLTPPSICCRAMLMCNSDLSTQHNIYQSIVRWAEGDSAIGVANARQQHQHHQQQQQQHQQRLLHSNNDNIMTDNSVIFTPANAAAHSTINNNTPPKRRVTFSANTDTPPN